MYARLLLIYARRRASGRVDFVCPPAGLRTHADWQYVPRHAPEYPGWDRGIFARSNWRGGFRFLGWYRHRIAPLREADPKNRPHPGVLGLRGDCLDRSTRTLACN